MTGKLGRLPLWPLVFLALALLAPLVTGPADPPSLAASAVQLLPPGTVVEEVALEGGGFVRGRELTVEPSGVRVRSERGWRSLTGVEAAGQPSTRRLWLGSDVQGRSLLARTARGAWTSLRVAALATVLALLLGTGVGLSSTLASSGIARSLLLISDALLGLPRLLLLLMLGVVLRTSPMGIAVAIGLASWMEVSRLVHAESLTLRSRPFISAIRASGAGRARLAVRHLVPNLMPILTVAAPLVATEAILLESTLSFLGLGGTGSWGSMVADGQSLLPGGWWIAVFPGLLLCITAVAVHRLGRAADTRAFTSPG